jgi:hypothetical protein
MPGSVSATSIIEARAMMSAGTIHTFDFTTDCEAYNRCELDILNN